MDPRDRYDEYEEQMRQIIYEGVDGGEDAGGDDADGDDFSSQILNDFGDGVKLEQSRDNEGALTNSGDVY